jgi:hypothetical protein
VNVGAYTIAVGGLGNGNYTIAYNNTGTLDITPRPVALKAANITRVYGESTPAFSIFVGVGSLAAGDTLASLGAPIFTTSPTDPAVNVGNYTIAVSGLGNSNYAIAYNNTGTLGITARPVTVTADPKTKLYGTSDPPLTYHITSGSLVGSDSFSGALSRAPGETVAGGPYAILQGTLALNGNYTLTYVGASLEILSWWTLNGFFSPVDMNVGATIIWNTARGGATIPIKFKLFADSIEITDTTQVKSLVVVQIACTGGMEAIVEEQVVATGGTSLRYDSTARQFVYNWQTPKKPGNCYTFTMTAADDSKITANFKLK